MESLSLLDPPPYPWCIAISFLECSTTKAAFRNFLSDQLLIIWYAERCQNVYWKLWARHRWERRIMARAFCCWEEKKEKTINDEEGIGEKFIKSKLGYSTFCFVSFFLEFRLASAVRIKFLRVSSCHLLLVAFRILPAFAFRFVLPSCAPRHSLRRRFPFVFLSPRWCDTAKRVGESSVCHEWRCRTNFAWSGGGGWKVTIFRRHVTVSGALSKVTCRG